ncbi:MAG: phage/plasmid primase, P4 family [Planctomycetota bacterium]
MNHSTLDRIASRIEDVTWSPDGTFIRGRCPVPGHDDQRPSFWAGVCGDRVHVKCHAGCSRGKVLAALGLTESDLGSFPGVRDDYVNAWPYEDEDGDIAYWVVRYPNKHFAIERTTPEGRVDGLGGTDRIPFNLRGIMRADHAETVFFVEGEKDAENINDLGGVATTTLGGASSPHLTDLSNLMGRRVCIVPDHDIAGFRYAMTVFEQLQRAGVASVSILLLDGLENKQDVSDWLEAGHTLDELLVLASSKAGGLDVLAEYITGEGDERVSDPRDVLQLSLGFLNAKYTLRGDPTLVYYAGDFYAYTEGSYRVIESAHIEKELYLYLAKLKVASKVKGGPARTLLKPDKALIERVRHALSRLRHREIDRGTHEWLDARSASVPAKQLLPARNGLVDVQSGMLVPATPQFFCTYHAPMDYDPGAGPPTAWFDFLDDIFDGDTQQMGVLQEFIGLCLTPDVRFHKMLLIVGPPRSGKGTIARVIRGLLGNQSVKGPTLSSLGGEFGLAPLLNAILAIISDARIQRGAAVGQIAERLLSISGEDALTVNRKFKETITVTLQSRLIIMSNELPRLQDSSGALAQRFIVLSLKKSFLGKEDTRLTDRLLADLPGILIWAMEGRRRLYERGKFIQPRAGEEALGMLTELASPVSTFVKECCDLTDGAETSVTDLHGSYRAWCERVGIDHPTPVQTFGRDLLAAHPEVSVSQRGSKESRYRVYRGVRLLPNAPRLGF